MAKTHETITYDKALKRIERIVSQLEEDNKSIDELAQLVKEASHLIKTCKQKLRMTEDEIAKAFEDEGI